MKEAGVVIDLQGKPLHWHTPWARTIVALPDSRNLWDVLWENRDNLLGFAHSHPGLGVPGPSYTDVTTFAAIEAGLGRRLQWWIASGDKFALVTWRGPDKLSYVAAPVYEEPTWVEHLRAISIEPLEQPKGEPSNVKESTL